MATSSSSAANEGSKGGENERFECNICFEQAKDAVVSMCGHLFCWPCIHRWMEARSSSPTCPVCKSVIDKARLIPLYGRGTSDKRDPRDTVPPRPSGQREEPEEQNAEGFGLDGIHVSFGIGAFPFTMFGGPMFQVFGGNGQQQGGQRPVNPQVREEEQRLVRIFMTIAVLVVILIVFA